MARQNAQQRRKNAPKKNVVHRGQKATLNGKPVIADGKGNWVATTKGTYGNAQYGGAKAGSYKKGEDRTTTPTPSTKKKPVPKWVGTTTVSGVEYRNDTGRAFGPKGADGISRTSNRGYSIDPKTGARTNGHSAPKAKAKEKPVERRPAQVPASTKNKPTKPKATSSKNAPAYSKPSTTKGPTKSGGFIASKGSSTKGGPTADGNTYKNQIKSKRLRDALNSLKVRDYKKKK